MTAPVIVRRALATEAATLADVWLRIAGAVPSWDPPPMDVLATELRTVMAEATDRSAVYVAVQSGRGAIGLVQVSLCGPTAAASTDPAGADPAATDPAATDPAPREPAAVLDRLGVLPDLSGRGLGRRLLARAVPFLEERGGFPLLAPVPAGAAALSGMLRHLGATPVPAPASGRAGAGRAASGRAITGRAADTEMWVIRDAATILRDHGIVVPFPQGRHPP